MKNVLQNWFTPLLHASVIVFSWATPWLIPWQFVVILFALYRLQLVVLKGCVLSYAQFPGKNEGFYYHYLKKIFPDIKKQRVGFVIDNVIPLMIIITAFIVQTKL